MTATSRASSTGASIASSVRTLVRAGQIFGRSGDVSVVAAKGLSAMLDPGEQVR